MSDRLNNDHLKPDYTWVESFSLEESPAGQPYEERLLIAQRNMLSELKHQLANLAWQN